MEIGPQLIMVNKPEPAELGYLYEVINSGTALQNKTKQVNSHNI